MTSGYPPISRLSNELLSEIFLHLRPDSEECWNGAVSVQGSYYRLEGDGARDSPALLNILRVCRHWRQVAQSLGSLWSDLRFIDNDPTLLHFMLQFTDAKNVTIDLPRLIISTSNHNGKLVRDHLTHIRELYLQFYSDEFAEDGVRSTLEETTERVLAPDATPVLEILRLENLGQFIFDPSSIPTITALDIPPRLKSLSLENIYVSMLEGFITTNITSFSINPAPPPWKCTEDDGLFDVLTCMPNLSSLTLDFGCYTPRVRSSPRSPPADLPHLRDLTFICTPAYYVYMVPSLSVPASTTRKIQSTDFAIFDRHAVPPGMIFQSHDVPTKQLLDACLDEFHSSLASSFTQWTSVNETSVCQVAYSVKGHGRHGEVTVNVKVTSRASSRSNFMDSNKLAPSLDPCRDPELVFSIEVYHGYGKIDEVLERALSFVSSISNMFPTDLVDSFHFTSDLPIASPDWPVPQWNPSFLNWTEVSLLRIEGAGAGAWFAPHLRLQRNQGTTPSMAVFPKLTELVLQKVNTEFTEGDMPDLRAIRKDLEDVMQVRAKTKEQKLKRLEVVNCGFRDLKGWVEQITERGWVEDGNVVWDRDEDEEGNGYEPA